MHDIDYIALHCCCVVCVQVNFTIQSQPAATVLKTNKRKKPRSEEKEDDDERGKFSTMTA